MIAPLRRRHQLMTLVLGFAILAFYLVALASRGPEPTVEALPPTLHGETAP